MSDATRVYSSKQENIVSIYLCADLTPNSGAGKSKKGDMTLYNTVIECKTKTKKSNSVSIKKEWIDILKQEAISMGKQYWALIFDYGTQELSDQYAIIPIDDYAEYLRYKGEVE